MKLSRGLGILVVFAILFVVQSASAASWYSGADFSNVYGVWADIRTPSQPIQQVQAPGSGQSNWVSLPGPNWIQTGWIYYWNYSGPFQYVETCVNGCVGSIPRYYQEFSPQPWGTTVSYLVDHAPGTADTWCAYINGVQKKCQSIVAPPIGVQIKSEVHEYLRNDLYTRFETPRYKDSAYSWRNFDSRTFYRWDFPYALYSMPDYSFTTYRQISKEVFLPSIMK